MYMANAAARNGSQVASRATATTVTASTNTSTGNGQIRRTATGAPTTAMRTSRSHGTGAGESAVDDGATAVEAVSNSVAA